MPVFHMAEQHMSKAFAVLMDYFTLKVSGRTGDRKPGKQDLKEEH